ncbi:hypothetical protein [Mycobacterium sp. EPa45]|uniref:hypothetical protein n=1 Tax=Mycobacterium sp. EPa45 TaxID=1545728 RepID=UPI000641E3F6|nr:hypothetical protein [Mycobacterium sp. EPa45]AKK27731.1 hypothetical protein AB431_14755 [Mycobacterium sp. EPa45]
MATAAAPRVGIIGARMSGLCMARKLQEAGIDSVVIHEQAHCDIRRYIRFGTEVIAARYENGRLRVSTDSGGFLRVPRVADIPGRDNFAGRAFHSARWDHSVHLPDKRIDQIRTGRVASAAPTKTYNEDIKAALPRTIWASGCNSWYIGKDGLSEVFPWHRGRHRELLRAPVVADFEVRTH